MRGLMRGLVIFVKSSAFFSFWCRGILFFYSLFYQTQLNSPVSVLIYKYHPVFKARHGVYTFCIIEIIVIVIVLLH